MIRELKDEYTYLECMEHKLMQDYDNWEMYHLRPQIKEAIEEVRNKMQDILYQINSVQCNIQMI